MENNVYRKLKDLVYYAIGVDINIIKNYVIKNNFNFKQWTAYSCGVKTNKFYIGIKK